MEFFASKGELRRMVPLNTTMPPNTRPNCQYSAETNDDVADVQVDSARDHPWTVYVMLVFDSNGQAEG